jgi:hypothetical protein
LKNVALSDDAIDFGSIAEGLVCLYTNKVNTTLLSLKSSIACWLEVGKERYYINKAIQSQSKFPNCIGIWVIHKVCPEEETEGKFHQNWG